ncbi:hypothetical protein OA92_07665 [Marinomonas sp. SBI22]|nr:hypothetical protein OA91_19865 [Marinomonas sp. SBI8L]KZM43569.1 hypothetical protein OA92_07665 [Marinomonas sp. SBI22]
MKLLVWTLIEIITLLVFSGSLLIWFKRRLEKDNEPENTPSGNTDPVSTDDQPEQAIKTNQSDDSSLKDLKRFIQNQILFAKKLLSKTELREDPKKVMLIKLWGTLLKAESRVLDTPDKAETDKILQQQLSKILTNIFSANKENEETKALKKKLAKLMEEANQSNEVLKLKEELEKAQSAIKKELLIQIEKLEKNLNRLKVKQREHNNLEQTLASAEKNVNQLKQALQNLEHNNEFDEIISSKQEDTTDINSDHAKHKANKQISALNQIAKRQEIVIDLLREKLSNTEKSSELEFDGSQEIAIGRIEQLIKESDNLILQLENELNTTNLSINSLKSEIEQKSKKLVEKEKQLSIAKKTAANSFIESTKNQQSHVDDMKNHLSNPPENDIMQGLILEQQKESDTLERLLKESETCVTLLESELETARKNNAEMLNTIKTVNPDFGRDSSDDVNNKFQQLENIHQQLLTEHSQVKQQLLASIDQDETGELRNEFNRKNLELDRLQLAIIDLEKKQIENSKKMYGE